MIPLLRTAPWSGLHRTRPPPSGPALSPKTPRRFRRGLAQKSTRSCREEKPRMHAHARSCKSPSSLTTPEKEKKRRRKKNARLRMRSLWALSRQTAPSWSAGFSARKIPKPRGFSSGSPRRAFFFSAAALFAEARRPTRKEFKGGALEPPQKKVRQSNGGVDFLV